MNLEFYQNRLNVNESTFSHVKALLKNEFTEERKGKQTFTGLCAYNSISCCFNVFDVR